jgi:hypothetical protein
VVLGPRGSSVRLSHRGSGLLFTKSAGMSLKFICHEPTHFQTVPPNKSQPNMLPLTHAHASPALFAKYTHQLFPCLSHLLMFTLITDVMQENCVNFFGEASLGKSATLNRPTRGGPAAAASYFAFCACAHSDVSNAFWSSSVANARNCELWKSCEDEDFGAEHMRTHCLEKLEVSHGSSIRSNYLSSRYTEDRWESLHFFGNSRPGG